MHQEDTEQDQNDQGQFKLDQEEIHSDWLHVCKGNTSNQ